MNQIVMDKLTSKKVTSEKKLDLQITSVQKIHGCLADLGLSSDEIELGEM